MIGIFDSGFGGLQTLKYFVETYPEYDYIFLADTKNNPYGDKSSDKIKCNTFLALDWLFDQGVKLCILACNTAAAFAIRPWQSKYPDMKVLSVTIPGIEVIINKDYKKIGVLMTQATYDSGIYPELYSKFGGKGDLYCIASPDIVPAIESGKCNNYDMVGLINKYKQLLPDDIDCLVLGCTHYPVCMNEFNAVFSGVDVVDPSYEAMLKTENYLMRHSDIESKLSCNSKVKIYTTGNKENFEKIGKNIYGKELSVKRIQLD